MASDFDMAAILDGLAGRLKEKSMFLSAVEAGEGAAEIRRLRERVAELEGDQPARSALELCPRCGEAPPDAGPVARGVAEIDQLRARVAELEGDLARLRTPEPRPACDHCRAVPAVMSRPHPGLGGESTNWCYRCHAWADRGYGDAAPAPDAGPVARGVAEIDGADIE